MFTLTSLHKVGGEGTQASNLPNSSADEKGENVGNKESVEDVTGEERGVAHHDTANTCPTAHSLARMTKPPFPVDIFIHI